MVGNLTGTDSMFHQNGWGGTESHFGIGGPWGDGKDGVVYQWGDTAYRADANLDGNHHVISIETGDNAPAHASDIKPWTEKQLDAIVDVVAWACQKHDIPAVLIPDTKPGRRGIGFHQQGVEHSDGVGTHKDFLVKGGERWSKAIGKECPAPARIKQVKEIVVPRVAARLRGEDDEMALDAKETRAAAKAGFLDALDEKVIENQPIHPGDPQGANWSLRTWAQAQDKKQDQQNENLGKIVANGVATVAGLATVATALANLKATVASVSGGDPAAVKAAFDAGVDRIEGAFEGLKASITIDTEGPSA